jgi:RNA polymerase sigma-70 factor (ECF subfamily)
MREFVLVEPPSTANADRTQPAAEAAARRDFEALLPESGRLAYRVARSVLRNDADAEDVAQESLLRAFRRFDRLRDRARFRSWLVRIAYRIAIDRVRARRRTAQRETLWFQESSRLASAVSSTAAAFQAQLEQAVDELPEKLRLALLLSAMEGHTIEEVAALLAIPAGTVKSRLFFAKKKVAEKLRCFVKPTENR